MKTYNSLLYLFALIFTLSFSSCSDSDSDNPEASELLIGEWLVVTESDYFCGTNEVWNERLTDRYQTTVYREDGTWQKYDNGVPASWTGTWKYLGENEYSLYWGNDDVTQVNTIEFPDDSIMYLKYGDCFEVEGESYETFTAWERQ